MAQRLEWVLLAYRLPREPSGPRVTVWRKLRRLGVAQILDGLVALPADARTREQLEWLADEVMEAGGEAWVWLGGRLGSARQERTLAARMVELVAADYDAVIADAAAGEGEAEVARRRVVARLRRELQRIARRDYFPPPQREQARAAVERLATRAGVHVDRAACAWLVRRFVDRKAEFVFVDDADEVEVDVTPFDMRGVELSHHGGDCSFETMLNRFELDDPVLWDMARIVHEADLADDRFDAPEAAGLDVICRGLSMVLDDSDVLSVTGALFDGLYELRRRALLLGRDPA
jgi:hypothetical protein